MLDLNSLCSLTVQDYASLGPFLIEQFDRFYSVLDVVTGGGVLFHSHLSHDFLCTTGASQIFSFLINKPTFCLFLLTSRGKYTPGTSLGLSSWWALCPERQTDATPVLYENPNLLILINKLTLEVKQVFFC